MTALHGGRTVSSPVACSVKHLKMDAGVASVAGHRCQSALGCLMAAKTLPRSAIVFPLAAERLGIKNARCLQQTCELLAKAPRKGSASASLG